MKQIKEKNESTRNRIKNWFIRHFTRKGRAEHKNATSNSKRSMPLGKEKPDSIMNGQDIRTNIKNLTPERALQANLITAVTTIERLTIQSNLVESLQLSHFDERDGNFIDLLKKVILSCTVNKDKNFDANLKKLKEKANYINKETLIKVKLTDDQLPLRFSLNHIVKSIDAYSNGQATIIPEVTGSSRFKTPTSYLEQPGEHKLKDGPIIRVPKRGVHAKQAHKYVDGDKWESHKPL